MNIEITLKNYRCFSDSKPAKFSLEKGFTSFVGANNSGKSTILKFFYEFRDIFELLSDQSRLYILIDILRGQFRQFKKPLSIMHGEELFNNTNNRGIEICFKFKNAKAIKEEGTPILRRVDINIPRDTQYNFDIKLYSNEGVVKLGDKVNEETLQFIGTKLCSGDKPIIELSDFLQLFKNLVNTLYIGAFRNVINVAPKNTSLVKYFDIGVGISFVNDWRNFKMGTMSKDNEDAYKVIEDIKHIFEFSNLDINPTASADTLKLLINGKSYFLSEVGSGIAQFILVFANAAMKKPSYILIDEPELNLHPSLQLDFLTTLGSYASEGILFSTHSIGLARSSADRVYTVRKDTSEGSEITELEATPRLSEFLGELNFSGYKELGFDKILLVEGPTEIKTIQQFLRLYEKDHKIVLLPLGGDSLISSSFESELEEIKRISKNISALIDSERSSTGAPLSPNRAAFVEICRKIGIKCHVLERRAIENYFTDRAVKNVKGEKYSALQPYQKLGEIKPRWPKHENWKIAREMYLNDLEATDIGNFLRAL
jgi:ABC-type multidrug transport system ATPase subunit